MPDEKRDEIGYVDTGLARLVRCDDGFLLFDAEATNGSTDIDRDKRLYEWRNEGVKHANPYEVVRVRIEVISEDNARCASCQEREIGACGRCKRVPSE